MPAYYEERKVDLEIFERKAKHSPPHIHRYVECIYLKKGSVELGIGEEFYHMDKGDFAIVFPDIIHHYQIFSQEDSYAIYIMISTELLDKFSNMLQNQCPKNPVINKNDVHKDIKYALENLIEIGSVKENKLDYLVTQSFAQIILARCFPFYEFMGKEMVQKDDIVNKVVTYIARNYLEKINLEEMAFELGYSQYTISRVFSSVFHTNFNKYVNNLRLEFAINLLESSNQSVTDVWLNSGFESQRTFNRVFKERYRMSPSVFRKNK